MPDKTPLYEIHVSGGARMVEFAGWLLPVQYTGIMDEHNAVRNKCGMFDIGHMGQIEVPDLETVQKLTTNDASKLEKGSGQYSLMCDESGKVIDDLLVYRLESGYLVIANGVNARTVCGHFKKKQSAAKLLYDKRTMLAVQGPEALSVLRRHCDADISSFKHRQIKECSLFGAKSLVSRSGYSGEDGAEIILENSDAAKIWKALLSEGVTPCGLGSRDTLRIEASLPLYGHELSLDATPLDAGYYKTVNFEKGEFTGRSALLRQKEEEPGRKLIGFEVLERAIPRQGYKIFEGDNEIGAVTSGTFSPTLGKPVGMGYIKINSKFEIRNTKQIPNSKFQTQNKEYERLFVEIRGQMYPIKIVQMPFYKRKRV